MSLTEQISKKRREIKTDGYPMSIREWVSMYERDELDIHPEFQRFYRWSANQKAVRLDLASLLTDLFCQRHLEFA